MTPFFSASPRPPLWRQLLPPLLAAGLVALLAATLLSPARNATDGGPLVGKSAPPLTLQTLDGSTISLVSLQGRPVILNFWASWCEPCREEIPALAALHARGIRVLTVAVADREADAQRFLGGAGPGLPLAHDRDQKLSRALGVSLLPYSLVLDARHRVVARVEGALDWTDASVIATLNRLMQ